MGKKQLCIIQAALTVFSQFGLNGASMDKIAAQANMSKSNIFYYFSSKEELYIAVLSYVLSVWLVPLNSISVDQDPIEALSTYIEAKLQLSKKLPEASRLYAMEMMQGAPHLKSTLKGPLKKSVAEKAQVIEQWIADGKIAPIDPMHLIFSIWALTQHYADFAVQVEALTGKTMSNRAFYAQTVNSVQQLLLGGLRSGNEPLCQQLAAPEISEQQQLS